MYRDVHSNQPCSYFLLCCLGYSLQLTRSVESDLKQSAGWTSDVISVSGGIFCLAVDLVLLSDVQAKLFEKSLNGTVSARYVFTSEGITDGRIRGEFQVPIDRDASQIQLSVF